MVGQRLRGVALILSDNEVELPGFVPAYDLEHPAGWAGVASLLRQGHEPVVIFLGVQRLAIGGPRGALKDRQGYPQVERGFYFEAF